MHNNNLINILSFGNKDFNNSLTELKDYLNYKIKICNDIPSNLDFINSQIALIHEDFFNLKLANKYLKDITIPIIILKKQDTQLIKNQNYNILSIPTSINNINSEISESLTKSRFFSNSNIKIKKYILNKNEKKLERNKFFIILTEKEINLLEEFIINKLPLSKKQILKKIWKYSSEADTHTVETHIYRLRKKIKEKFDDENFILNDKKGYFL